MKKNDIIYLIITGIVAVAILYSFINSGMFVNSFFTGFNILFVLFFCIIFGSIICQIIKSSKHYNKTDKKTDRYFENKLDEINNNTYNDPLDKEMDHLSEELKNQHLKNEGIISDKYSDLDKFGNVALFLTIKDLTSLDSFSQKVDEKEFNEHYVGQHVLIYKNGLKRRYKDL